MVDYKDYKGFYDYDASRLIQGNNNYATQGLFTETRIKGRVQAMYTLKTRTHIKNGIEFPSAYLIYMNSVDEYDAAIKLVGSLDHWRELCACTWFMHGSVPNCSFEGLIRWREDMEARDRSVAKRALLDAQAEGNVAAARYLHEKSGKIKTPKKQIKKEGSSVLALANKRLSK